MAPGGTGSAAPATKVVLAYTAIIPTLLPQWLAFESGLFRQNGLNAEVTYIESTKGMAAIIAVKRVRSQRQEARSQQLRFDIRHRDASGPQKASWSQGSDVFLRPYVNGNRGVVQKYVDSIIQSIVRIKRDKPYAIDVMKKYEKIDNPEILDVTYDYYAQKVLQTIPYPKPEQYADPKSIFGETNEAARNLDVANIIDDSFVKNAAARGVDKQ